MKNIYLIILFVLAFSLHSITQIEIIENKDSLIGSFKYLGQEQISLSKSQSNGGSYFFHYKNLEYSQLVDWKKLPIDNITTLNQMYDLSIKIIEEKNTEGTTAVLSDGSTINFYYDKNWKGVRWIIIDKLGIRSSTISMKIKDLTALFGK